MDGDILRLAVHVLEALRARHLEVIDKATGLALDHPDLEGPTQLEAVLAIAHGLDGDPGRTLPGPARELLEEARNVQQLMARQA